MFLTDEELVELTGLRQGAAQIRWLHKFGVAHYVRADGRPRVTRAAVEGSGPAVKSVDDEKPNFAALHEAH